ncbi:hypothetical protein MCEET85_00856 [Candidatus Methylopumilus planktonicus]|uniref:hypothetical protein n=1 Tax=Candidatus Methylopumilus planktonicus TaxID=1581557 RepID=UPI003BEEFA42
MHSEETSRINSNDLIIMFKENRKQFFSIFLITLLLQLVILLNTPVTKKVFITTTNEHMLKKIQVFDSYIKSEFINENIKFHGERNGLVVFISAKKLDKKNTKNQIKIIWKLLDKFLINNSEILIESCKKFKNKIDTESACKAFSKNTTGDLTQSELRELSKTIFILKIDAEDSLWRIRLILKIFHSFILSIVIFFMLKIFKKI